MGYDLDHTPVIIRMARWKMVLLFLVSTAFVAVGITMTRSQAGLPGYFVTGFFALSLAASIWQLLRPGWLELLPSGLRWYTGRKIEQYDWDDFLEFTTYSPATFTRHVGFNLAPNSEKRTRGNVLAQGLAGIDGGFGGGWELKASDLADLLNLAKAKWNVPR